MLLRFSGQFIEEPITNKANKGTFIKFELGFIKEIVDIRHTLSQPQDIK